MFLFKSLGSRQSRTFFPFFVSVMLHTIEFTQSVGSVTGVIIPSASILSSSALYSGIMCTGTVRGACTTGLASSMSLISYFAPGKRPILSKQSLYSFSTLSLLSACADIFVLLTLLTSSVIIPSSSACWQPRIDGLFGALTTLKSARVDLSRYVIFMFVVP